VIIFQRPIMLSLFIGLIFLIYMKHIYKQRGMRIPFSYCIAPVPFHAPIHWKRFISFFAMIAYWLAWGALIIALSEPSFVHREKKFLSRGIDIIIVLDESPSMAAQDVKLFSRFTIAKNVIKDFIFQRENDAIGLVTFSSQARVRVPPTLDYTYLAGVLEDLNISTIEEGSAIGMGILLGALHLNTSSAAEKVIILLTDGVNTAGEITPITAAGIAKKMNIRIYTIGIGSNREALLEYRDRQTGSLYRGAIRDSFDEQLLITLAEKSGGTYFYASDAQQLQKVFTTINSVEVKKKYVRVEVQAVPIYRFFVVSMLLLFTMSFFLYKVVLQEGGV